MRRLLPRGLDNERGMALVVALVLMLSLTLIATAAIMTSNTEIQISANNKQSKLVFYTAEGAWQLAVNWLDNRLSPPLAAQDATGELGDCQYCYRVEPDTLRNSPLAGYSADYQNLYFIVRSCGKTADGAEKEVEVRVSKPFKQGY